MPLCPPGTKIEVLLLTSLIFCSQFAYDYSNAFQIVQRKFAQQKLGTTKDQWRETQHFRPEQVAATMQQALTSRLSFL
ncbi:hypothetical protein HK14_15695 [Acetobacter cibinongensis]|uniref:Uncharacterized protein n=1 Tax=Acetobacter cibinongensis TaxID=146475 RepID=A0A1Z5YR74_9PROT|nr:hypothetical protein HK14_15695 [Acetobacter cibinongensis]